MTQQQQQKYRTKTATATATANTTTTALIQLIALHLRMVRYQRNKQYIQFPRASTQPRPSLFVTLFSVILRRPKGWVRHTWRRNGRFVGPAREGRRSHSPGRSLLRPGIFLERGVGGFFWGATTDVIQWGR